MCEYWHYNSKLIMGILTLFKSAPPSKKRTKVQIKNNGKMNIFTAPIYLGGGRQGPGLKDSAK